ncbi:hypothetical protein BKH42_08670 [Helicobacter sp. 13S00482-2]|uniref:Dna2/Cas4 domain-containing protein n=1 Tax=Helicobacter sp. 13S00482-2 TaxID=1476200 RepID=UPI000BC621AC|nr:Dna2/Cas4 domain-containing protein [Helicobacter sp. 13S00482-2]PAF52935.1 hypothetical protein BKH42_08670 [Helicobacter sp. 13S00482-2]
MKENLNFKKFIIDGLRKANEQDNSLGDRSQYIGASDIGQCPRKCYLGKINKQVLEERELLAFARGHASEEKFKKSFEAAKINFDSQLEIRSKKHNWIVIHPDFLLKMKNEDIAIECKDTKTIPEIPYESWVLQLQLQMGVLLENGYNIKRGMILVTGMLEEKLQAFECFFDPVLYELALKRAQKVWDALQSNIEPEAEKSLLCSYCHFQQDCPKMQIKTEMTLPNEFLDKVEKIKSFSATEKIIKSYKQEITDFLKSTDVKNARAGDYKVSLSWYQGREKIDTTKIPTEILKLATNKGDPYPVLKIS